MDEPLRKRNHSPPRNNNTGNHTRSNLVRSKGSPRSYHYFQGKTSCPDRPGTRRRYFDGSLNNSRLHSILPQPLVQSLIPVLLLLAPQQITNEKLLPPRCAQVSRVPNMNSSTIGPVKKAPIKFRQPLTRIHADEENNELFQIFQSPKINFSHAHFKPKHQQPHPSIASNPQRQDHMMDSNSLSLSS